MASSRELAEKAFALLQNALRDSESRAANLDAELKKKRAPKNQTEERADVLEHRLKSAEAECLHWQREAGHLEEIVANERVKVQQLKKKLEVAESGPDKLSKKEVNFWRQRAEIFDNETREYKKKIAELKSELRERHDLADDYIPEAPPPLDSGTDSGADLQVELDNARVEIDRLRERLLERDKDIAAIANAGQSNEADASALRQTLAAREAALRDSEQAVQGLRGELQRVKDEIGGYSSAASEADAVNEKIADTLKAREARIAELSAELERTRAELQTRQTEQSSLNTDVDAARRELAEKDAQITELRELERTAHIDRDQLRAALAEREQAVQALSAEVEEIRGGQAERDAEMERLREAQQARLDELEQARREAQELGAARAALEEELTALRQAQVRLESELAEAHGRAESSSTQSREIAESLNEEIAERERRIAQLEQEKEAVREQIAGLEDELKEEKEGAENLRELANERREEIAKLEERLDEAQERFEEAKWQLGRAAHFEKLVQRRKDLIQSLIAELRNKSKANTALKAGLDGLRTFKATAEQNQQKLVARIDNLTTKLHEAEETVSKYQGETVTKEELSIASERAMQLEERVNTQIELIESLEGELKQAKASRQSHEDQVGEIDRLREEIEAKNEAIARLEADADEQQKRLAKLRGSESETMRLKAVQEKDAGLIESLQREIAQLKESLAEQRALAETGEPDPAGMNEKLKERDSSIARLMGTVKEQEKEIARLNEAVSAWKKKYEFLSTEAPDAYQSVAEK